MPDESSIPAVPWGPSSKCDVKRWTNVYRKTAFAVGVGLAMAFPLAATIAAPAVSAAPAATPKAASPCSKVSGASVGAIVGRSAPALSSLSGTIANSRSVESGGNLSTQILCVYGDAEFTLTNTVTAAPTAPSAIKKSSAQGAGHGVKVTFTSYSGLGVPGFRITTVIAATKGGSKGEVTDEIGGISGKTVFAASASSSLTGSLSVSKLAALAKLAKKL
jgi:hypothetical protein